MVISHFGLGMVKVQLGDRVIVFNPIGKGADLEPTKFGADLALVSLNDAAYNGVEQVSRGDRVPFVIDGPGEYEIEGNFVRGFPSAGPSGRLNTIYLLVLDGVRLVHLGALTEPNLSDQIVEALGTIDILFTPVTGVGKLVTTLEPRVAVPINYDSRSLAAFLKETGTKNGAPVESWTVKKKELAEHEGEVVVIKSF